MAILPSRRCRRFAKPKSTDEDIEAIAAYLAAAAQVR
jgi:hypothetical protein